MQSKHRKILFAFLLLSVLTFLTDKLVHRLGNALEKSPYWDGNMATNFVRSQDASVFLFGDCRVAWYLDPERIGSLLHKKVFNAGTTQASTLGFTDFFLNVAISQGYKGHAVFVLTDLWFTDTEENVRTGFNDQRRWQNFIEPSRLEALNITYPFPSIVYESGYYRYFGRGPELARSIARMATNRKLSAFSDGYLRPDFLFLDRTEFFKEEKKLIQKDKRKDFKTNAYAEQKLRSIISIAKSSGLIPVLVLAPAHAEYSTVPFKEKLKKLVNAVASETNSVLIDFQKENNSFSDDNGLWLETVHLNYEGSKKFSIELAAELDKVIRPKQNL